MAEDWHQTPRDILEKVSVVDMRRWRLLKVARYDAEQDRERQRELDRQMGRKPGPVMELDEADLIDGMYLPEAEDDA